MITRPLTGRKGRKTRGARFAPLVAYMVAGRGQERVSWYYTRNLEGLEEQRLWDVAAGVVEVHQSVNKRVDEFRKTYHLMVSFDPNDPVLSSEQLTEIVDESLQVVGLSEHHAIAVRHSDQEHEHLHIAVNKVHPETGKVHHPYYDIPNLKTMARKFEKRFGLRVLEDGGTKRALSANARTIEAQRGEESFGSWCQRHLGRIDLETVKDWKDFHSRLRQCGVEIVPRGRGLALRDDLRHESHCKASEVSRSWSKSQLEGRFGTYEGVRDLSAIAKGERADCVKRYEKKPTAKLWHGRLWQEYERAVKRLEAKRKLMFELRGGAVGHGVLAALPLSNRDRAEMYRQRAWLRRVRRVAAPYPRIPSWKEFLAERASQGDREAEQLLSKARNRVKLRRAGASGSPHRGRVSSRGTRIVSSAGRHRYAVTAATVTLLGQATEESISGLLELARKEFGKELELEAPESVRVLVETQASNVGIRVRGAKSRERGGR